MVKSVSVPKCAHRTRIIMKGVNKAQRSLAWMMPQRFLRASSLKILSEKEMGLCGQCKLLWHFDLFLNGQVMLIADSVRLTLVSRASRSHLYWVPMSGKCSTTWHISLLFLLYNFNDDLIHSSKPDFKASSLKKSGKKISGTM